MVQIHINIEEIIAELKGKRDDYLDVVHKGWAEAGRLIVDIFRGRWLGGRSGGLGLNIVTGRLNQSVKSLTEVNSGNLRSLVFNRGADYWWYHENPAAGRQKYLYLEEAFQDDGGKLYTSVLDQALGRLAA